MAYAAATDLISSAQVFVRYLDSPAGLQLTHFKEYATPVGWTPDGRRIIFGRVSLPWEQWVQTWKLDQSGQTSPAPFTVPTKLVPVGEPLYPAFGEPGA